MSASISISAPHYGRSLSGLGFNLIVRDVDEALRFATAVLGAELQFRTDAFAALALCGQAFMLHQDKTYRNNALFGSLQSAEARGIGVELRAYGVDPDKAEQEHGSRASACWPEASTSRMGFAKPCFWMAMAICGYLLFICQQVQTPDEHA